MGTDQQQVDESLQKKKVDEIMSSLHDPRANNKPVLYSQNLEMQRLQNGGYPKHMYHETLAAVLCLNDTQYQSLAAMGFVEHYIPKRYPKVMYRRNLDSKFSHMDFVEERQIATPDVERELLSRQPTWKNHPGEVEEMPQGLEEDSALTIARLQGQLDEARSKSKTK